MTMRSFCDSCDRDISDDDNTVCVRLEASMRAVAQGRFPLKGKELDYCITCAKRLLPEIWKCLEVQTENEK
jgi:hypothetical protein